MDWMDAVLLARLQFAFTVMFHYLFPPLSIGLGLILVIMEGTYLWTKNPIYEVMTKFWVTVFALVFGLGVATGIVMEFQFGTNWSYYSRYVGDVFGSALAAEGIFAFFLESGFLAILVFGWDKVGPKMHFFATCMVALGSMFSAVWIVIADSWMQTPAGFHIVEDANGFMRAEITDFWELVFNPSSMNRLTHVLIGCYILAAFVVMSISAFYILRNRHLEFARRSFIIALILGLLASLVQPMVGHFSAEIVAEHQPAKMAAYEAVFETTEGAGLYMFGIPDVENETVHYGIQIPNLLSFLLTWDFNGEVTGLDQFPREDWPPVQITFQSYHLMVACGMFFIAITLLATFLLWRRRLFRTRWLLWTFVFAVVLPFLANQAGWVAAEVGRQPWIVYNLLRTSDAVSPAVKATDVLASIIMFGIVYLLLFVLFVWVLDRKIRRGPSEVEAAYEGGQRQTFLDAVANWEYGDKGLLHTEGENGNESPPPGDGGTDETNREEDK